jgi:alpha-glucosidase
LKIYLPEGKWYDLFNDNVLEAGKHIVSAPKDKLPVFVKAGGMLLMQSLTQNADEAHSGVLELHVYAGSEGSKIHFYDDDGLTYDYENGAFANREIKLSNNSLEIGGQIGEYNSSFEQIKIYWHGFSPKMKVKQNGLDVLISKEDYLFVNPISNFDPFEKQGKNDKMVSDLAFSVLALKAKSVINLKIEA